MAVIDDGSAFTARLLVSVACSGGQDKPMTSVAMSAGGMSRTVSAQHVPALDGWRGLAIACVLVAHFVGVPWAAAGRLGVDLFFVLSGLLMANILFVHKTALSVFYFRRISRIVPAFLVFVLSMFFGAWAGGFPVPWNELLPTLLFVRSYLPSSPDIWHTALPIGHLWSLNVEEHCYIAMGLLTVSPWFKGRRAWTALLGLALLSILLRLTAAYVPGPFGGDMAGVRTETAAGHLMLSAGYSLIKDRFAQWVQPWMPPTALFTGAVCYTDFVPWWSTLIVAPPMLAFAVNHLGEAAAAMRSALSWSPLRMLGVWSFSIYLWQQPFFQWRQDFPWGLALIGACLSGLASFYFIEQPMRTWMNARWARP